MAHNDDFESMPSESAAASTARGALQAVGGTIPYIGGFISAIAGAWSESEQRKANKFFEYWIQMLKDELREKEKTIVEIVNRLNLQDETIAARVEGKEYQSLIRKAFREWSGAESEKKRVLVRNLLVNAAYPGLTDDDVVRLFLDWINQYSELHFQVMGVMYNSNGLTRSEIWAKIGKGNVREDSAEADLFRLLIHDLSVGRIIRQHRATNLQGDFLKRKAQRTKGKPSTTMKSAFDNFEAYVLTALGQQFVHFAINELTPRVEFSAEDN